MGVCFSWRVSRLGAHDGYVSRGAAPAWEYKALRELLHFLLHAYHEYDHGPERRDAGRTPTKGMPGDSRLIFERLDIMLRVKASDIYV